MAKLVSFGGAGGAPRFPSAGARLHRHLNDSSRAPPGFFDGRRMYQVMRYSNDDQPDGTPSHAVGFGQWPMYVTSIAAVDRRCRQPSSLAGSPRPSSSRPHHAPRRARCLRGPASPCRAASPSEPRNAMTAVSTGIVRYRPGFAPDFARLNREWLERYFTVEPLDEEYLGDPAGRILAPGGEIFFAVQAGTVVGTCAAIRRGDDQFELAKLCVTPTAQGRGIGRALATAMMEFARERGARRVVLVSSSRLTAALRLYEALGFAHRPFPGPPPYADADVYMELAFPDRAPARA